MHSLSTPSTTSVLVFSIMEPLYVELPVTRGSHDIEHRPAHCTRTTVLAIALVFPDPHLSSSTPLPSNPPVLKLSRGKQLDTDAFGFTHCRGLQPPASPVSSATVRIRYVPFPLQVSVCCVLAGAWRGPSTERTTSMFAATVRAPTMAGSHAGSVNGIPPSHRFIPLGGMGDSAGDTSAGRALPLVCPSPSRATSRASTHPCPSTRDSYDERDFFSPGEGVLNCHSGTGQE